MNGFIHDLQYRVIKTTLNLLAEIPRSQLIRLAIPLGKIWYGLDHYHRRIALKNMWSAFGREKKAFEIKQMVRANFIQLVRVTLEIPSLLKLSRHNLDAYVDISGQENLKSALARGKGVLVLTAHLGNWELMALAASIELDLPMNVMARPLDSVPFDRVITEIRSRTGNQVLNKDKSAGIVSQMLNENQVIGILLDQNSSWYEGVYVPFFDKRACTNKGLAMFAMRYGAHVVPVFNIRLADGRYRIIFEPPLKLVRTGDVSRDILENTARFNTIIEKYVRMAPDNWLWVHRRWRIKEIPEHARKKIKGLPA
jgi:KDO2-lipid IV(A) lauroyltransferase